MRTININALSLIVLLFILSYVCCQEYNEDSWIEPNAWGREVGLNVLQQLNALDENDVCLKCKVNSYTEGAECPSTEDALALIYFKKFIANLFNRNKLEYDEYSNLYQRTLLFTIQPEQLEKLERLNDPRDLDSVLTEIFAKARTTQLKSSSIDLGFITPFLDTLKDLLQHFKNSEIQFLLLVTLIILVGWFLHRRYKIGVIVLIFVGLFLSGYLFTYIECNRELENAQMLEIIKNAEKRQSPEELPWYSLSRWFGYNQPVELTLSEKIKKSSKINLGFCRPDHVLILYANDLLLKQLQFMIEKCSSTINSFKENLSFPFNYVADFLLLALIAYLIKLTFKYILSPKAWAALIHHPAKFTTQHQQHAHSNAALTHNQQNAAITEDRISGENLKILLDVIKKAPNVVQNTDSKQVVSGVEEVLEQLEPSPATTSKSNSPNTSMEQQQHTEVKEIKT